MTVSKPELAALFALGGGVCEWDFSLKCGIAKTEGRGTVKGKGKGRGIGGKKWVWLCAAFSCTLTNDA